MPHKVFEAADPEDTRYRDLCAAGAQLQQTSFQQDSGLVNARDIIELDPGFTGPPSPATIPGFYEDDLTVESDSQFSREFTGEVSGAKPPLGSCMPLKDTPITPVKNYDTDLAKAFSYFLNLGNRPFYDATDVGGGYLKSSFFFGEKLGRTDGALGCPDVIDFTTPLFPPGTDPLPYDHTHIKALADLNRFKAQHCYNYYILNHSQWPWYHLERPSKSGTDNPLTMFDPNRSYLNDCQPLVNGTDAQKIQKAYWATQGRAEPFTDAEAGSPSLGQTFNPATLEKTTGFSKVLRYLNRPDMDEAEYLPGKYYQKSWDESFVQIATHPDNDGGKFTVPTPLPQEFDNIFAAAPNDSIGHPCIRPLNGDDAGGDCEVQTADCDLPVPSYERYISPDRQRSDPGYCPNVEKITEPSHPFSPRHDVQGVQYKTDRKYSALTAVSYGDPCRNGCGYTDWGACHTRGINKYDDKYPAVQCAIVPVEILDFRKEQFDNCIMQRINININDWTRRGQPRQFNVDGTGGGYEPPCSTRFWEKDKGNCPAKLSIQQCCRIIVKDVVPVNFLKIRTAEGLKEKRRRDDAMQQDLLQLGVVPPRDRAPKGIVQRQDAPDAVYALEMDLQWLDDLFTGDAHAASGTVIPGGPLGSTPVGGTATPGGSPGSRPAGGGAIPTDTTIPGGTPIPGGGTPTPGGGAPTTPTTPTTLPLPSGTTPTITPSGTTPAGETTPTGGTPPTGGGGTSCPAAAAPPEEYDDKIVNITDEDFNMKDTPADHVQGGGDHEQDYYRAFMANLVLNKDVRDREYTEPEEYRFNHYKFEEGMNSFKVPAVPFENPFEYGEEPKLDGFAASLPTGGMQYYSSIVGYNMPYMRWWDTGVSAGNRLHGGSFVNTLGGFDTLLGVGREERDKKTAELMGLRSTRLCATDAGRLGQEQPSQMGRVGGWAELKAHQMWSIRRNNLFCLARYEKVFKPGSAENLVHAKAGAGYSSMQSRQWPWSLGWRGYATDSHDVARAEHPPQKWQFPFFPETYNPTSGKDYNGQTVDIDGNPISAIIADGTPPLDPLDTSPRGLDHALPGDIITITLNGLPHIYYVTKLGWPIDVNRPDAKWDYVRNKYMVAGNPILPDRVFVESWDQGKFPTSTGSSIHWGYGPERVIFKHAVDMKNREEICNKRIRALTDYSEIWETTTASTKCRDLMRDPAMALTPSECMNKKCQPSCVDPDVRACVLPNGVEDWRLAKVYRPAYDVRRCTGVVTYPQPSVPPLATDFSVDATYDWYAPLVTDPNKQNPVRSALNVIFQGSSTEVGTDLWAFCHNGGFDPPQHFAREYKGAQTGALTDVTLCGPKWGDCSTVKPDERKCFPKLAGMLDCPAPVLTGPPAPPPPTP